MTKEDRAAKAEARQSQKIIDVAKIMVPCKHLTIWAECRKADDQVQPSEVWRVLLTADDVFTYDYKTSVFALSKTTKKETNA